MDKLSKQTVTMTSVRELSESFGAGVAPDRFGILSGDPVLFVDLDEGGVAQISPLVRQSSMVLIGISRSVRVVALSPSSELDNFDILLTEIASSPSPWVHCRDLDEVMSVVQRSIQASEQAAVSLVQLLRFSACLSIGDALVAESVVYSMLQSGRSHPSRLAGRFATARRETSDAAVVLERVGDRLNILLNRPQVHNALNTRMRDELIGVFDLASADRSIREISLSGAGPSFCSGGDLDEFGIADNPLDAHFVRTTASVARAMCGCADRTSVFVHGACVGAGIEIAAFARHIAATHDALFALPEVSMGLIPGAGGTVSLTRRIGRQRTAFMALVGQPVHADVALAWGLIDEVRGPGNAVHRGVHFEYE